MDNLDIKINFIKIDDAKEILEYCKKVGSQSNNLTFGEEGLGFTIEKEKELINLMLQDKKSMMFVARYNNTIIGLSSYNSRSRRLSHIADIGISVLEEYWNKKVATRLIESMIDFAKNVAMSKVLTLEVKTDNLNAIALYEKFGFEKIATFKKFFKIDDEFFDAHIMNLYL